MQSTAPLSPQFSKADKQLHSKTDTGATESLEPNFVQAGPGTLSIGVVALTALLKRQLDIQPEVKRTIQ